MTEENFTDHLLNLGATRGYKEGYKQGREDALDDIFFLLYDKNYINQDDEKYLKEELVKLKERKWKDLNE